MTREEFLDRIDEIMCGTSNAERAYLENLYNEVVAPLWISVDDELPPKGQWVLCFTKSDSEINTLRYDIYNWKGICFAVSLDDVTHWMPLPQPPTVAKNATVKEGGEE